MRIAGVEDIREGENDLLVQVRFHEKGSVTLPCQFAPLVDWLKVKPKAEIIALLHDREMDITVRGGAIVSMKSLHPGGAAIARQSTVRGSSTRKSLTTTAKSQGTTSKRTKTTRRQGFGKKQAGTRPRGQRSEPMSGGLRICPICHDVVSTIVSRQGGKRVFRCKQCGYPTGYA